MRIIIFFTICFACSIGLIANTNNEKNRENISLYGLDQLDIYTSSGDIEITTEDRDDIYVDLKTYKRGPQLYVEKGRTTKIEVKSQKNWWFNFSSRGQVKLTVVIPKNYKNNLQITSSSGDVHITNMDLSTLKVKLSSGDLTTETLKTILSDLTTSSGDINISKIKTNKLNVVLSSGDLSIDKIIGEVEGRVSSGSVNLNFEKLLGDINLRLSSGSAFIILEEKVLNAKLDLKTSSGDIKVKYPVTTESQKNNRLSGYSGSGKYDINITSSSGNITIR